MAQRDEHNPNKRGMSNVMASEEGANAKKKQTDSGGGRKAILLLFFLSILLSLFFWMHGQLAEWLQSFFGPSTWTFTR